MGSARLALVSVQAHGQHGQTTLTRLSSIARGSQNATPFKPLVSAQTHDAGQVITCENQVTMTNERNINKTALLYAIAKDAITKLQSQELT